MQFFSLNSSSSSSPSLSETREQNSRALLYLNVYDLTPINNYLYWIGLGIYHSGIEVHGLEYGFGAHDYPSSGVFEVEPRSCPGFKFRRSLLLGSTDMSRSEFRSFIEKLSRRYYGDTYHLIAKNCNHFTEDVSMQLTGRPIPGWVNRMARLGSFCNCLLPESIRIQAVILPTNVNFSDDDGSDSGSSLTLMSDDDDDDEASDHHLLSRPSIDLTILEDKPVRLARELM